MPGVSQALVRLLHGRSRTPSNSKIAPHGADASAFVPRQAHSVSASHEFRVHADGTVSVRMIIEYVLQPGATIAEGFKSILSKASSTRNVTGLSVCDDSRS
eukprot:TRINITY_DN7614_c0_g1_i2.p1 TRINITY_DN7614_c0_g1~~TRINITY_DN7614_c0_g1_i2.p1  ORF type:complete len:118 (-),score=12.19 TRINITY_DN7614_c0_g1_i2:385-687(-)